MGIHNCKRKDSAIHPSTLSNVHRSPSLLKAKDTQQRMLYEHWSVWVWFLRIMVGCLPITIDSQGHDSGTHALVSIGCLWESEWAQWYVWNTSLLFFFAYICVSSRRVEGRGQRRRGGMFIGGLVSRLKISSLFISVSSLLWPVNK